IGFTHFGGCRDFTRQRESESARVARVSAAIARGKRPVPFQPRKLRLAAPMVLRGRLCGRVGPRRTFFRKATRKGGLSSLCRRVFGVAQCFIEDCWGVSCM